MYSIKDFSDWTPDYGTMVSGANEKVWLHKGNERGLFKFAKINQGVPCGEYWSEKMAEDLAKIAGIPCMKVDIGIYEGRLGSFCYDFSKKEGKFQELADILESRDFPHGEYDLWVVRDILGYPLFLDIIRVLLFDYVIGNLDRHSGNIGIIQKEDRLTPLYDNGSSLCCRINPLIIPEVYRDSVRMRSYTHTTKKTRIRKPSGGFFKLFELMEYISSNFREEFSYGLESIVKLEYGSVESSLGNFKQVVDNSLLEFLCIVIDKRVKLLEGMI